MTDQEYVQEMHNRLGIAFQQFCDDRKAPNGVERFPRGEEICNYFFRNWYSPHTFLFRKSIKVTNLQYAELQALIRLHSHFAITRDIISESTNLSGKNYCASIYAKSKDMKNSFISLWHADPLSTPNIDGKKLTWDTPSVSQFLSTFARRYCAVFADTILFDAYATSALCCTSPFVHLLLERICGEAGYVYAAGPTIYMRRSGKVQAVELQEKVAQWLAHNRKDRQSKKKIPFVIYSKEHFPISDNPDIARAELNGLDDLRFHLDKFYFSTTPVADIARELTDKAKAKKQGDERRRDWAVQIDNHLAFKIDKHNPSAKVACFSEGQSIWLMMDRPAVDEPHTKPRQRYFVCFVQEYRNAHQMFETDEAKPGWTQPVTLPHTLASAMFNIARGALKSPNGPIRCLDPFAGGGTTFFEAAKVCQAVRFRAVDIYAANKVAFEVNRQVFALSLQEKRTLLAGIADILKGMSLTELRRNAAKEFDRKGGRFLKLCGGDADYWRDRGRKAEITKLDDKFKWAFALAKDAFADAKSSTMKDGIWALEPLAAIASIELSDEQIDDITHINTSILQRILFFAVWKALISNIYQFFAESASSAERLSSQLVASELAKLHERLRRVPTVEGWPLVADATDGATLVSRRSQYSKATSTDFRAVTQRVDYEVADVMALSEAAVRERDEPRRELYDVVITDPPYGFNVRSTKSMPELYDAFIKLTLVRLRDGGQAIFCVPSSPMNGQAIPYFMMADFVTKQFALWARRLGKVIRKPTGHASDFLEQLTEPLYWESERALRREIVHFAVYGR